MLILDVAGHALIASNKASLSVFLVGFGYVIPILSSVRAVIHQDIDAHHQWITYWIILTLFHIIEPFIDVAFHPWLKVMILAWLSLPRYQGAFFIYDKIIVPKLDKYETTVDGHLDGMKAEAKRRAWSYILGTGWGMIEKFMRFRDLAIEGNLFASENSEHGEQAEGQMEMEVSNPTIKQQSPLHSISFAENHEEDKDYVTDFLDMLARGLFVFALVMNSDSDEKTAEEYKLRIFAFDYERKAFLLSPIDDNKNKDQTMTMVIDGIHQIIEAKKENGISICLKGGIEVCIVLPSVEDRNTLLHGLHVCYSCSEIIMKQKGL